MCVYFKKVKKIIILLITVSIMLTSCGKSAGLSNSDKRADNNPPPSASSSFKGNLPQITDGKNSIIQPLTDFVNEYKKAISLTAVAAVIVVGAFFAIKWIINNKLPKGLKPLPEVQTAFMVNYFINPLSNGDYNNYPFDRCSDQTLIFTYRSQSTYPAWRPPIKNELARRCYDVSTLE
jgi:hypothetical protein